MDGQTLAQYFIGGILKKDLDLPKGTSSLLWEYLEDYDFVLTPLPNHLFQRDNTAFVYDGLSVNPMAKPARKRETLHSRAIWNFHPLFRTTTCTSTTATTTRTTSRPPSRAATSW